MKGGDSLPEKKRTVTFRFFRDPGGRLRATCVEGDFTRPVESAVGKRYRFRKIFSEVWKFLSSDDRWRLQTAKQGDVITVELTALPMPVTSPGK